MEYCSTILHKTLARLSLRAIWKNLPDFARESRASVTDHADLAEAYEDFLISIQLSANFERFSTKFLYLG